MATFKKAVKSQSYLRLALSGPAGSGKTYTALTLAEALADGKPVAVIDTERGSASKYSDLFPFDVLELDSFHPDRYVEAIKAAASEGYGVVIIDSYSHAWNGHDGILEQVERIGKMRYNGNSFKAWGDIKPMENRLIEAITGSPIHIIATMRSKTEYVVEQNERGKATPRKVGTAPIQRDGTEYEFDVFGEMNPDNELMIQKTRCPALTGALIAKPGKPLAETLRVWLAGAPPEPKPPTRSVAPIATVVADDDDDETIPYTPDDEEPQEPTAAEREEAVWKPMADVKFITTLKTIGVTSAADIETFISDAQQHYPVLTLHEACLDEYGRIRFEQQEQQKREKAVATQAATRGRGPHALGAVAALGEEAHDLAELGAGSGRH